MITLDNVLLIVPSSKQEVSDLEGWVNDNIDPKEAMPWLNRAFPGRRLARIAWPTGYRPTRPIKLNSFFYPCWGASRFGYGHYLCASNQIKDIRNISWGSTGLRSPFPMDLTLSSPGMSVAGEFKTKVSVLRVIPLGRTDPPATTIGPGPPGPPGPVVDFVNGLYLVTVVDERFFWWYKSYPNAKTKKSETWEKMFEDCVTALGITKPTITVPAAYLKADPAICNLFGEVIPPLLDAICYNTGMRLVRAMDGKYRVDDGQNESQKHKDQQKAWSTKAGEDFYREKL